jgi:hypothetical protein
LLAYIIPDLIQHFVNTPKGSFVLLIKPLAELVDRSGTNDFLNCILQSSDSCVLLFKPLAEPLDRSGINDYSICILRSIVALY